MDTSCMTFANARYIFLVLVSLATNAVAGFHGTAWTNLVLSSNQVVVTSVWATTHSIVVTNWNNNTPSLSTNTYTSNHHFQKWTNAGVVDTWSVVCFTNGEPTIVAYVVTSTPTQVNAALQSREIVALDSLSAITERARALNSTSTVANLIATFPSVYHRERDALVWVKQWIKANATNGWVDASYADTNGEYVSYFKSNPTNAPPTFTSITNFLGTNIPPNYLDETPWTSLWPTDSGYSRVQTCSVFIVGIATQTFTNCCGGTSTFVSTNSNGLSTNLVCTNSILWDAAGTNWYGTKSSEWGWKHITNLLAKMIHTTSGFCGSPQASDMALQTIEYDYDTGPYCANFASVIDAVTNGWTDNDNADCDGSTGPFKPYVYFSSLSCSPSGNGHFYHLYNLFNTNNACGGGAGSYGMDVRHQVGAASTGLDHRAYMYASVSTNCPVNISLPSTNFVYDDNGWGYTTNKSVFSSATYTGPVTNAVRVGQDPNSGNGLTQLPTTASEPASPDVLSVRGHAQPEILWIIRWDIANGFDFR